MTVPLLAIIGFMLAQFGIGVWVSRRVRTEADYLVAGRRLGYPLAIFSIFATWFGAESVIGASGVTYQEGISLASAEPYGYGLCLIFMGLVFAGPLWRRKLTTLADFYRQRFSTRVEHLAALILIPTSVLWAAAQIRAFGQVLASASTLDADLAITVAAVATTAYTVVGGMLVDAITDLIQGGLLVIGLLALLVAVVVQLGGAEVALATVAASERISLTAGPDGMLASVEAWAVPVLGSVVATEVVARVIATRSAVVAQRAAVYAGMLYIAIGSIPVFVGIVGAGIVPVVAEPEQMLPAVAQELLSPVMFGVFAGGLLCAILSTVDSTLLVASGLLSHNLVVPLFSVSAEATRVTLARAGVILFAIIAYVLALRSESVFALIEESSALGSAGVLVTVSFGLFTRLGGPRAAVITLLTGITVYSASSFGGFSYPFLLSLAASATVYLATAILESPDRRRALRDGGGDVEDAGHASA